MDRYRAVDRYRGRAPYGVLHIVKQKLDRAYRQLSLVLSLICLLKTISVSLCVISCCYLSFLFLLTFHSLSLSLSLSLSPSFTLSLSQPPLLISISVSLLISLSLSLPSKEARFPGLDLGFLFLAKLFPCAWFSLSFLPE